MGEGVKTDRTPDKIINKTDSFKLRIDHLALKWREKNQTIQ